MHLIRSGGWNESWTAPGQGKFNAGVWMTTTCRTTSRRRGRSVADHLLVVRAMAAVPVPVSRPDRPAGPGPATIDAEGAGGRHDLPAEGRRAGAERAAVSWPVAAVRIEG